MNTLLLILLLTISHNDIFNRRIIILPELIVYANTETVWVKAETRIYNLRILSDSTKEQKK